MGEEPAGLSTSRSIYEGDPLAYPGRLAPTGVVVVDGDVRPISARGARFVTADGRDVDELLVAVGAPPIAARVAQAAFGANRDVRNLAWKLRVRDDRRSARSMSFVVLPAVVPDADVVACNVGYWGYVYGGLLLRGPARLGRDELAGLRCPVAVVLLDEWQLRAVHHSEGVVEAGQDPPGVSCRVADLDVVLADGRMCATQAYSLAVPFLSLDGEHPVPLAAVATSQRSAPAMTQSELFERIADRLGVPGGASGRVPIADELAAVAAAARRDGADVHAVVGAHATFRSVRAAIVDRLAWRDADGTVRHGLEDAVPVRPSEASYDPSPRFRPRPRQPANATTRSPS